MSNPRPTTNERLGYPADTRLLIVNADDFGMCQAINEAIIQTLETGIVTSTSLMVPCPSAAAAMQWLARHPAIPFGVHLTLVRDSPRHQWGPTAAEDQVPSLRDPTGLFFLNARSPELLAQAELDEVEAEFRAQIETVLAASLQPTHLDWHCLPAGGRSDIFDLTFNLAKEYGLALRIHDRATADRCRHADLPASDHDLLDSYRLSPVDKSEQYTQRLRHLPAGLSEWAVHPSLDTAEFRMLEPDSWQVRTTDFAFLTSREARAIVGEEEIVLVDYRALQAHWSA